MRPRRGAALAAVILVLVSTALLASLFPARRATTSVDPAQALQAV